MAFTHTFASLSKVVNSAADLSAYALNEDISKSLEKRAIVTSNNNTFTIDPNDAALFIVNISNDSVIEIEDLDADYSEDTGAVFSILVTLNSSGYVVTWPSNITWSDGDAPELAYKNLITLIKFDSESNWVGGFTVVEEDFPR